MRAALLAIVCLFAPEAYCADSEPPTAALPDPVRLAASFDTAELEFLKTPGNSSVAVRAALRLADGSIRDCAGFAVELLPVTAYSSERIARTYGNLRRGQILLEQNPPRFTPDVKEYHELLLKGACDDQGVARFERVPAGDYFAMAFIIWDANAGASLRKAGGAVMHRLRVRPRDTLAIRAGALAPDGP